MIVEGDEISEMLLRKVVKSFGNETLHARTGTEAVEASRKNSDFDLILMDIKMPDLIGHDATKQIRQFNEKVVIIAQTAYGLINDRKKAIESGCNDYISKPIMKDQLIAMMRKYFKIQEEEGRW